MLQKASDTPAAKTYASPLRAAVIGTGKISEEHLRFLGNSPAASLVGVCDLSLSLAQYAATRFGAHKSYTDAAKMLAEAQPDVVHVLTPAHTHVALARQCLSAGAHVVVEKPVAPTNAEFRELWNEARAANLWIIEDHNYRFNQPVRQIQKLLADGTLGELSEVEIRLVLNIREKGGRLADETLPHPVHYLPAGAIHEFITHLVYLALLFEPRVDRVAAAWRNIGGGSLFKADDLDALLFGGPVHTRIRFSSYQAPDCFTVTVRGSRGWAETDLFQPHLKLYVPRPGGKQLTPLVNQFVNGASLARASTRNFRNKIMQRTPYEGLATFLDQTYSALRQGSEPPVTYADMDAASRLVDALLAPENQV